MTEQREDGGLRGAGEAGPVPLRAAYWTPELVLLAARVAQMGYGPKAGEDAIPRDFPRSRFLATRRLSLREQAVPHSTLWVQDLMLGRGRAAA